MAAALAVAMVLMAVTPAHAGRRVVVLEFEGPKAERFRADVEAAVDKGHTVVSLDDWLDEASELGAEKPTARNVKKVARKLGVDGVIVGEVEKRGGRYYVNLRLREGVSGEYVAEVEVVVRAAKLGSDGARTVKQELLPAIDDLASMDDADDEVGKGKRARSGFGGKGRRGRDDDADDDDEPRSRRKPGGRRGGDDDDDDRRRSRADDDDDDAPRGGRKRRGKGDDERVSSARRDDDGDDGGDGDPEIEIEDDDDDDDDDGARGATDPLGRALEVTLGVSAVARRLSFDGDLAQEYRGGPVGGARLDAVVYPLAFGKRRRSFTRDLGVVVTFDRVLKISSTVAYNDATMTPQVATIPTTQQQLSAGLVYRHRAGRALLVEASARYTKRTFSLDKSAAPAEAGLTVPSVDYAYLDPGVAARYVVSPKLVVGGGLRVGLALGAGELQQPESFGATTVLPIDVSAGLAYQLTPAIALHADLALVTYGLTFKAATMRTDPDGDGVIDIAGGRDTYVGGTLAAGYAF